MRPSLACLYAIILCLLTATAAAQPHIWHRMTIDNGLPKSDITSVYRHSDGILFIGIPSGVIRYDGHRYTRLHMNNGSSPWVRKMMEDKYGTIWMITRDGLYYLPHAADTFFIMQEQQLLAPQDFTLDKKTGNLLVSVATTYKVDVNKKRLYDSAATGGSYRIFSEPDGSLVMLQWMTRPLVRWRKGRIDTLYQDTNICNAVQLRDGRSYALLCPGKIIVINADGISKEIDLSGIKFRYSKVQEYFFECMRDGTIWFAPDEAIVSIADVNTPIPRVHKNHTDNNTTFLTGWVNAVYLDVNNVLWGGCAGTGVSYADPLSRGISFYANKELGVETVWPLLEDSLTGRIFASTTHTICSGTPDGYGGYTWKNYPLPKKETSTLVSAMYDLNAHEWLAGTVGEGFFLVDKKTLKFTHLPTPQSFHKSISGFIRISENEILAYSSSLTFIYHIAERKVTPSYNINHHALCAVKDVNDHIWLGRNTGLGKYIPGKGTMDVKLPDSLELASPVLCLYIDGDIMYIGTISHGMFTMPLSGTPVLKQVTAPADIHAIYGMIPVGDILVSSTDNGIWLLHKKTRRSVLLNRDNLIPNSDFSQFSYAEGKDKLYFGGERGIVAIAKDSLPSFFRNKVDWIFTVAGKSVTSIDIPAGQSNLEVLVRPSFPLPNQKQGFDYRLEGFEHEWQLAEGAQLLKYKNVPPGNYTLHIKTKDPTGLTPSVEMRLPIYVDALFYQTIWAKVVALLLLLVVVALLVRYFAQLRLKKRIRQYEIEGKLQEERSRISGELHDNVGSELTQLISGLELSELMAQKDGDVQLSAELHRLRGTARQSLQGLRDSIWALHEESMTPATLSAYCHKWLDKAQQTNTGIRCRFEPDIHTERIVQPLTALNLFRILQEACTNAIKYSKAGELNVTLHATAAGITLNIADNGVGIPHSPAEGYGLKTMRRRADAMEARLAIDSQPAEGTRISLILDEKAFVRQGGNP